MWRVIVGPIVGYFVMVVFVISCIAAVWFSLGHSFAFKPGTFDASLGWTIAMLVSGLFAAIAGGIIAKVIGRSQTAVFGLAGLILAMGVLTIVGQSVSDPVVPPADLKTERLKASRSARLDSMRKVQCGTTTPSSSWESLGPWREAA